ncbi:hypothetical protein AB0L25_40135 [Spirillospora sp. NPDC052242]
MTTERCIHDMIIGQCGLCAPVPEGLAERVYITRGGSVFHARTNCDALQDGQRKASRLGLEIHDANLVPLSDALLQGRGACEICFPGYRP